MGRSRERQRSVLISRAVRGTLLPLIRALFRRPVKVTREFGDRRDRSRHGLPEDEAVRIALAATHAAREEMGRGLEPEDRLPAPSPEEVRQRREERRMREAEGFH